MEMKNTGLLYSSKDMLIENDCFILGWIQKYVHLSFSLLHINPLNTCVEIGITRSEGSEISKPETGT